MTTHKNTKLTQIADIIIGIPDSKQGSSSGENVVNYNLIQPNHLGKFNQTLGSSTIIKLNPISDSYLVRSNDILIKRLNPDYVVLIDEARPKTTISSNLFIIRVHEKYSPAYIACLLENLDSANVFGNVVGSVAPIRSISQKALAQLTIPHIPYEKQKSVGQLWLLHKRRQKLYEDLQTEDYRLMTAIAKSVTSVIKEEE